jgi:hypothetical protein
MTKLTEPEKQIIKARCSSEKFSDLSEVDKKVASAQIVTLGSAITGCATPNTDYFLEVLCNEIAECICEFGYGELTEDEIKLALRLNYKGGNKHPSGLEIEQVQFTGHTFNVNFLSQVLSNYLALRKHLDRKFQNHIDGY